MNSVLVVANNIPQSRKLFRLTELATKESCIKEPYYNSELEYGYIYLANITFTIVANHTNPIIKGQKYDEVFNFSSIMNVFMDKYLEGVASVQMEKKKEEAQG